MMTMILMMIAVIVMMMMTMFMIKWSCQWCSWWWQQHLWCRLCLSNYMWCFGGLYRSHNTRKIICFLEDQNIQWPLLAARTKFNSFQRIGEILLKKEFRMKFEYHQGTNMDGWISKGGVQIKGDICSYVNEILTFVQKSSKQGHFKDSWF